jgi:ectoine hydroxylase-related dioxygenase (phytanoyl-CoA dioxygenase family)
MIKWLHPQGGLSRTHGMHVDSPFAQPSGFGYVAIVNWLLTDYTLDAGPFCFVPGSHKWGRPPTEETVTPEVLSQVKGVEAPANSFIIFNASLWHGSLRRTRPGMRLSANTQRCLPQIIPNGNFRDVSDQVIDASDDPEVMRMLCWKNDTRGLASGGLAYDRRRGIPMAAAATGSEIKPSIPR